MFQTNLWKQSREYSQFLFPRRDFSAAQEDRWEIPVSQRLEMLKNEESFLELLLTKENRVFNHWTRRKKIPWKKYKKEHFWSLMQKTKVTQIKRSNFADRNEQVEETNLELELIKTLEIFLLNKVFMPAI